MGNGDWGRHGFVAGVADFRRLLVSYVCLGRSNCLLARPRLPARGGNFVANETNIVDYGNISFRQRTNVKDLPVAVVMFASQELKDRIQC
jgi:hypothetical protein